MAADNSIPETPEQQLVRVFERNGCLRVPNIERRNAESRTYKMGYEIRLVATTKRELTELRRVIRAAGLRSGKPFAKVNRWIQPIYGRQAMEFFVALLGKFGNNESQLIAAEFPNLQTKKADNKAINQSARSAAN